jgi:hypothetical protein
MYQTSQTNRGRCTRAAIASVGLLLTASGPAFSHHPSGITSSGTSGPIITIPGTTLAKGASAVFFTFQHVSFDELSDAVLEAAAEADKDVHSLRSTETPSLGLAYGLTDRLMLLLQLPYVAQTDIREGEHHDEGGHHHEGGEAGNEVVNLGDADGIGDLTLLGQYRFFGQDAGLQASLLAGVTAPTGKTDERDNEGVLFETEFQPGSGSWVGLVGLAVSKPLGRWSLDGNVLYTVATEGAQQTDLGDQFQYNGSLSYRVTGPAGEGEHKHAHAHDQADHDHHSHGLTVDLVLELNGEWQAKENFAVITDPNSGGNVVYLSPGLRLSSNRLSGFVSFGVPIVNDLNGIQSEPTYRVVSGLVLAFN